jgi:hypothetical protein
MGEETKGRYIGGELMEGREGNMQDRERRRKGKRKGKGKGRGIHRGRDAGERHRRRNIQEAQEIDKRGNRQRGRNTEERMRRRDRGEETGGKR